MCPVYDAAAGKCRVTPWDSAALQDEGTKRSYCTSGYHSNCGNYEAYRRGDYKVERD